MVCPALCKCHSVFFGRRPSTDSHLPLLLAAAVCSHIWTPSVPTELIPSSSLPLQLAIEMMGRPLPLPLHRREADIASVKSFSQLQALLASPARVC